MIRRSRLFSDLAFVLPILVVSGVGCELITKVDRSLIPGTGGAGGAGGAGPSTSSQTSSSSTTSNTGGATATSSSGTTSTGGSSTTSNTGGAATTGNGGAGGAGGAGGTASGGSGGAGGSCAVGGTACISVIDCPVPSTACVLVACNAGCCEATDADPEAACTDDGGHHCDGAGTCVECVQDADCPATGTVCATPTCASHACTPTNATKGTPCSDNGGAVCSGAGKCVAQHCNDSVLDADETDVDCGGSCAGCGDLQHCVVAGDCIDRVCPQGSHTCQPATCGDNVKNGNETDTDCGGAGYKGAPPCAPCAVNKTCGANSDCASGLCSGGICKLKADGASCANGSQCASAACVASNGGVGLICCATPCTDQGSASCGTNGACLADGSACSTYPNGTACSDGDACTQTDTCQGGSCSPGAPVTCTALDPCHVAGTCDTSTGICSNPPKADGLACDDGNACTQSDTCQGGACVGGAPVTCTALNQCHVAGTCDTSTGLCSNPAKADGVACDDGDACTQADTCQGGACTGGAPVTCTALDSCHVAGTCDSSTGCSNPAKSDGTACDDGDVCTSGDSCQSGICTGNACASGLCGSSLTAFTGASTPGWNFNGSAAYDAGVNTVVLADGTSNGQAGTLIYKDPIAVDSFTAVFDFKVTSTNGRADGIAFMLETDGNTAVGSAFGGFGVLGLSGYGVELDVFDSGPCDPGNGNHAGIDLLSSCGANGGIPSAVATSPDLFGVGVGDIADGNWRTATLQMTSGAISVTITNAASTPFVIGNLQGVTLPGFVSGTPYYFGFGAGTGSNGLASRQEIRNVQITFPGATCL